MFLVVGILQKNKKVLHLWSCLLKPKFNMTWDTIGCVKVISHQLRTMSKHTSKSMRDANPKLLPIC